MSIIDILESRMTQLFEGSNIAAPFDFKRLAKVTVHQMRRNVSKVDGHKFAPTLYSILINPNDDRLMIPLYAQVTAELEDFLAHEAGNEGLEMTDEPLVRFMAEPGVRQGAIDVMAEIVPSDILGELRREEAAYVRSRGGAQAPDRQAPAPAPRHAPAPERRAARPAPVPAPAPIAAAPAGRRAASSACELTDMRSGRTWRIAVPSTVIGREGSTADLLLPDTNVSRRHAELTRGPSGWSITDLGSTNGTRVNGTRVQQAELHDGDTITLGLIELAFKEL